MSASLSLTKGRKHEYFPASLMQPGDSHGYRVYTVDSFVPATLSRIKSNEYDAVGFNDFILDMVPDLGDRLDSVYIPRLLDPRRGRSPKVKCLKTGGRTFLLDDKRISEPIILNLKRFGWSKKDVFQEFRLEVKGGGTFIEDAGISISGVEKLAEESGNLRLAEYARKIRDSKEHPLAITRKDDRHRPKGAQLQEYETQGLEVSNLLQKSLPVKFAPTISVRSFPDQVQQTIKFFDRALPTYEKLCSRPLDEYVQGIRLTPSTVRAIYLDKAKSDSELVNLVTRISQDPVALEKTAAAMLDDTRRYLDVIATTTETDGEKHYKWIRVGDVFLSWQSDTSSHNWVQSEAERYMKNHAFAWYLAKDITVAAGTGFWFVDLESLAGGTEYETTRKSADCDSRRDLKRKHDLSVLCVLRDFQRVITQFQIGRYIFSGESLSSSRRREIQQGVLEGMAASINRSKNLDAKITDKGFTVDMNYTNLSFSYTNTFPYEHINLRPM